MKMRKPTGREYFFIVVLAAFGIGYLAYRDDGRLFGGGRDEQKKSGAFGIAPIVRMAQLAARTEDYNPRGRNLFEYYTPPPPPRKEPAQRAAPPKPQSKAPVSRPAPTRRVEAKPVNAGLRPPNINLTYLGYLGPKDDKIAVFEDGEDMLLARAGEIVHKDFTVVEFKFESVVMGYVDTRFKEMTTELDMRRN
jgi:hypothetical protein